VVTESTVRKAVRAVQGAGGLTVVGNARHLSGDAVVPELGHPDPVDRPVPWTGLTAHDDPADTVKVDRVERAEERLARDEPDSRRDDAEIVNTGERGGVLDGHPSIDSPASPAAR